MSNYFYILTLALLATHELDAVSRHEWRLFPLLNKLSDRLASLVFVSVHIPLFWLIFWLSWYPEPDVRISFQIGFAVFSIIHVAVHFVLRQHRANEFNNPLSQLLIWGCGAAGAIYLGLVFWG